MRAPIGVDESGIRYKINVYLPISFLPHKCEQKRHDDASIERSSRGWFLQVGRKVVDAISSCRHVVLILGRKTARESTVQQSHEQVPGIARIRAFQRIARQVGKASVLVPFCFVLAYITILFCPCMYSCVEREKQGVRGVPSTKR